MALMAKNTETRYTSMLDEYDDGFTKKPAGRKLHPRPPPFLIKTFEMVDDPETNPFIAWNSTGTGFVIWDHNKFSAHVLPTVFKTSNFSSFVYQLNSYGFRKISWERYEYANQWFQAGKRHWLKNIKRRNQLSDWAQPGEKRRRGHKGTHATIEARLDNLITEQNDMRRNIQRLERSMDDMESLMTSLEMPRFPELEDEKINTELFLGRFMKCLGQKEKVEKGSSLVAEGSSGPAKEELLVPVENSENSTRDEENDGNFHCWSKMLEYDGGLEESNEGKGDLADIHAKVMLEFDEMMELSPGGGEEMIMSNSKPSNLDCEDEGLIDLWE